MSLNDFRDAPLVWIKGAGLRPTESKMADFLEHFRSRKLARVEGAAPRNGASRAEGLRSSNKFCFFGENLTIFKRADQNFWSKFWMRGRGVNL